MKIPLKDGDYVLEEGKAWVEYKTLVVRICESIDGSGLIVSIFPNGDETAGAIVQATASYSEGEGAK